MNRFIRIGSVDSKFQLIFGKLMSRMRRIVIYPQDVALITGRSDRYGRMVIKRIKEELGKEDHNFVTIKEFSEYTGIEMELIESVIYG